MTRLPFLPALLLSLALLGACGDPDAPAAGDDVPADTGPGDDTGDTGDTGDSGDTGDTGEIPAVPLERPHAGGNPAAVQVVGEVAYAAVGPHLEVWSLEDPTRPTLLGDTEPLGGILSSVTVVGGRAYMVERQDLDSVIHVVDVADPAAPVAVSTFRTVEEGTYTVVHAVATDGARLYAADQEHGIFVFDLADPDAPALLELLPNPGVTGVEVSGTRLHYVSESFIGSWFGMIDLSEGYPEVGGVSLSGVNGTAKPDDLLVGVGVDGAAVYRFDDDDPWSAQAVFTYTGLYARAVAGSGDVAWIPADDGLYALDLADPAAVSIAGPLDAPTAGGDAISVAGDLLTVATDRGRLLTFDVVSPLEPRVLGTLDMTLCTDCASLAFDQDGTLYIADVAGGLRTATLADLAALGRDTLEGSIAMEDVTVGDGLAYVSDWFQGLHVFDVSDPAAPRLLTTLSTGGYVSSVALAGEGRIVIGESTNGGMVHVVDVSDPTQPAVVGTRVTSKVRDLQVHGDLVYVADETLDLAGGLRILDISDPTDIVELSHYGDGCANAIQVDVQGDLAALACASDDFHLVDVADPTAPVALATWPAEDVNSAHAVALDGTRAYFGHDTAVIAVDVTDPAAPTELASWPISYAARAIEVPFAGRVVAACGLGGVYQWTIE